MRYTITNGIEKSKVKTKRYVAAAAASTLLFGATSVTAFAAGPYNAIPGSNPVFNSSGQGSIQNDNNPALRFGQGGRIAIPGQAGDHASSNSAVAPYSTDGSGGIVDPRGAF